MIKKVLEAVQIKKEKEKRKLNKWLFIGSLMVMSIHSTTIQNYGGLE